MLYSSWEWLQDINLASVAYEGLLQALEHFIVELRFVLNHAT